MKKFSVELAKPKQKEQREKLASKTNKNAVSNSEAHDKKKMKDRFANKNSPEAEDHVTPKKLNEHNVGRQHWPNEKPW